MTPQQENFKKECITGEGNVVLRAYAGTGKTTTIEWTVNDIPEDKTISCVAFNKRIADELARRMAGPNVQCKTMNAIGHAAWARLARGKLELDRFKNWKIRDKMKVDPDEFPGLPRAMALAKAHGLIPDIAKPSAQGLLPDNLDTWNELFDRFDIEVGFCKDPANVVREALCASITAAWDGYIDFDDQLFMSAMYRADFRTTNFVFADEAQDLSHIQRHMIAQMLRPGGKMVAVGDPHQAIYAFRGADSDSMANITEQFKCKTMPLSISFRCPKAVVGAAQQYVPDIESAPSAAEGQVVYHDRYDHSLFRPGDAILCRNNAPVIAMCFKLIKKGIKASVLGREIGQGLIKLLQPWPDETDIPALSREMWQQITQQADALEAKKQPHKKQFLLDKGECIDAIIGQMRPGGTKLDVVAAIERIFSDKVTPVTLSTVHKAKGLEWPRVFILDSWLIGKRAETEAQKQQEDNLHYVAITRAKDTLGYIESEGYRGK